MTASPGARFATPRAPSWSIYGAVMAAGAFRVIVVAAHPLTLAEVVQSALGELEVELAVETRTSALSRAHLGAVDGAEILCSPGRLGRQRRRWP